MGNIAHMTRALSAHLRSSFRRLPLTTLLLCSSTLVALAQAPAGDRNAPVSFTADDVQYDREGGIVTASGHVEATQNDRTLRADRIVFDRNTGVAAATGHVVLIEPDGQVVFSEYAELTQDMKDGVLTGMRALLAQNGKLAANGARRTDAKINELSGAIYTTCDLCKDDPTSPPEWEIHARSAVQNVEKKTIEYYNAWVDFYGIPVFYTPYLAHPDPTQKRATGLLPPSYGSTTFLGTFVQLPYYVVIDDQSDVTLTPTLTTDGGQALFGDYRIRLNEGLIRVRGSLSDDRDIAQGHLFAHGDFALDDVWRWGFDLNRASNATYVRDYRIAPNQSVLTSSAYLEGFGYGSYARTDFRLYQNLSTNSSRLLPFVAPRTQYSFLGQPDSWGGRLAVDTGAFNVIRSDGTNTKRVNLSLDYSRPFVDSMGDLFTTGVHLDSAVYDAHGLAQQPTYANASSGQTAQAMPTAYAEWRLPLQRVSSAGWGTQTITPIAKAMLAPDGLSYATSRIPNEDALDQEFTDSTLFLLNRNQGTDRLEGGARLAVALQGDWTLAGGAKFSGLVGQSFRAQKDPYFTKQSGLRDSISDIVARQSVTPNSHLDLTIRERVDHRTGQIKFADGVTTFGFEKFQFNVGYLYSTTAPYTYYDNVPTSTTSLNDLKTPRNEVYFGASTRIVDHWTLGGSVRQDVHLHKSLYTDLNATYEDECLIFNVNAYHRYTSQLGDRGDSGVLFSITLKSVGEFGFNGG